MYDFYFQTFPVYTYEMSVSNISRMVPHEREKAKKKIREDPDFKSLPLKVSYLIQDLPLRHKRVTKSDG